MPHLRVAGWQANGAIWAKCDMLATVSLDRLNKPYIKTRSGRNYITHSLSDVDMNAVLNCMRAYLSL